MASHFACFGSMRLGRVREIECIEVLVLVFIVSLNCCCSLQLPPAVPWSTDMERIFIEPLSRMSEGRSTQAVTTPRDGVPRPSPRVSAKVAPEMITEPLKLSNERDVESVSASSPKWSKHSQWGRTDRGGCDLAIVLRTFIYSGRRSISSCDVEFSACGKSGKQGTNSNSSQESGGGDGDGEDPPASCFLRLRRAIEKVQPNRWMWILKKRRNGDGFAKKKNFARKLESLPFDIRERIFQRIPFQELFRCKVLSKSCGELAENDSMLLLRSGDSESPEGSFTAINFFVKENEWQCIGLELESHKWTRLPPFSTLPTPDANLFKEYSVCGDAGLVCANVSKVSHKEEIVVLNLLTKETRYLPSLHFPRIPVLLHILVDSDATCSHHHSYKVVAAGSSSSSSGDSHLSRKIEVFDSQTSKWRVAEDLHGPEYGLNEHQTGVCVDGILHFITFLESGGDCGHKGIAAFDVARGKWVKKRNCSIPFSPQSNILQLVENGGNVYLFSEQEHGSDVEHCIDVLQFGESGGEAGECQCELKRVVTVKKAEGRGLLVYPEYACVPYGDGKLCVFNTIKRGGLVYDIQTGMQCEVLEEPPAHHRGENFFSLNPVSFTLQPNFLSKP